MRIRTSLISVVLVVAVLLFFGCSAAPSGQSAKNPGVGEVISISETAKVKILSAEFKSVSDIKGNPSIPFCINQDNQVKNFILITFDFTTDKDEDISAGFGWIHIVTPDQNLYRYTSTCSWVKRNTDKSISDKSLLKSYVVFPLPFSLDASSIESARINVTLANYEIPLKIAPLR